VSKKHREDKEQNTANKSNTEFNMEILWDF